MAKNMPRKVIDPTEFRIQASQFGEYYRDRLLLDAATNGSTAASMIVGNCKASLDRKTGKIDAKIQWMADNRGIGSEEMIQELLGRSPVVPSIETKLATAAKSVGLSSGVELMEAIADGTVEVRYA